MEWPNNNMEFSRVSAFLKKKLTVNNDLQLSW